jgi:CheY-like chemotaxis protein
MVFIPRIVTVDPTGIVARVVRSALELLDLSVIQMDIPFASDALNEIDERVTLVITSYTLDAELSGFELAHRLKKSAPNTSVIVLADNEGSTVDERQLDSHFIYLARPLNIHHFLQVLLGGLESPDAMRKAYLSEAKPSHSTDDDLGIVPKIDTNAARKILEKLQTELASMAIVLADRTGVALLEVGTTTYFNRDELALSLVPMMKTNLGMREIVGGQVTTVQFYDGDNYDVFVLSVGLHHFISVVFEGEQGARQFGFVNRFGRKAVEDLIGLIGASAFFVISTPPASSTKQEELLKRQTITAKTVPVVEEPVELARADITFDDDTGGGETLTPTLEPITDLNLDLLFGDGMEVDESLFDFDNLASSGKEDANFFKKGKISWDDAKDLGVLKD